MSTMVEARSGCSPARNGASNAAAERTSKAFSYCMLAVVEHTTSTPNNNTVGQ